MLELDGVAIRGLGYVFVISYYRGDSSPSLYTQS